VKSIVISQILWLGSYVRDQSSAPTRERIAYVHSLDASFIVPLHQRYIADLLCSATGLPEVGAFPCSMSWRIGAAHLPKTIMDNKENIIRTFTELALRSQEW
jgi:hypothetical protein